MYAQIILSAKSKKDLINYIIREISKQIINRLISQKANLKNTINQYIRKTFFESEAVRSMINEDGELKGDLGLDASIQSNLEKILDVILTNLRVDGPLVKIYGNTTEISMRWKILQGGYNDLISLKESFYHSVGQSPLGREWSGSKIPWLEWLLIGCPGVQGWVTHKGKYSREESRSQIRIMWRSKSKSWSMPEKFVGNENKNFLTEIFMGIENIITQEVDKVISA